MLKLLRNAAALTATRALTMLGVLYIASWTMKTGVLYWGIILALFGSIVQITSLNLNHSMAVVFVSWEERSQKSAVLQIVLFRVIFGIVLFGYAIGSDALLGLDLFGHWILFFGVLFRLIFDSLYGYARATIRQDVMALMTVTESFALLGGLSLASAHSSASVDFKIFTVIVLATYFFGSALAIKSLFMGAEGFSRSLSKLSLRLDNFKTLISTGLSIYPIASIDMLWLSGAVFLLLHLGQVELIPAYVLLQRLCTLVALGFSVPNSLLAQTIAMPGNENKLFIVLMGLFSIIISGFFVGAVIILYFNQIASLFNVNPELIVHRRALEYVLGYCLVLAASLCGSVLLSIGQKKIVFFGGLLFWAVSTIAISFMDSLKILSIQSFFGTIATGLCLIVIVMSYFIYRFGLRK